MSTEYIVYNANGVEISLNDSGSDFSLDLYGYSSKNVKLYAEKDTKIIDLNGSDILIGTQTILKPEDVVSMALKMMQAALYHIDSPESVKKDIINQVVGM